MATTNGLRHPFKDYVDRWLRDLRDAGVSPRITSGFRTHVEQKRLYDRAQSGASPFPAAPPGASFHEAGLAIDLVWNSLEDINLGIESAPDYGLVWAGAGDPVHFQAGPELVAAVVENTEQFGAYWHILKSVTCSPFNIFVPLPLELLAC